MEDLVQFLRARLDEDERIARLMEQHFPSPWEMSDRGWMAHVVADGPVFREVVRLEQWHGQPEGIWLGEVIQHVALHDPARVLREVEAKRELLAEYESAQRVVDEIAYPDMQDVGRAAGLEYAVRLLALPYSDRNGYKEKWRP